MIKPWEKVGSKTLGEFKIFTVRSETRISPRTSQPHDFYVIDAVDWVNVIALTPDRNLVMVEQYRHGSDTVELEIPGGMMDPGESRPEIAGARELREETGYEGKRPKVIGKVFPNPAFMTNVCYTVLLEDCRCLHPVAFDHGEDLATRLVPVDEIRPLIVSGKIRHSVVLAALYHYELWKGDALAGKT